MALNRIWEDGEQSPEFKQVDAEADKIKEADHKSGGK